MRLFALATTSMIFGGLLYQVMISHSAVHTILLLAGLGVTGLIGLTYLYVGEGSRK